MDEKGMVRGIYFALVFIMTSLFISLRGAEKEDLPDEATQTKTTIITGVIGTVYNAVEGQCCGDPLITADGSKINKDKLKSGEIKWIAVSRDLLEIFNYGDKVEISGAGKYDGIWEIHDTMSPKLKNHIDFLVPDNIKTGKWKNITISSI